jgi:DUF1365 family protein
VSLEAWLHEAFITEHTTSQQEISELLAIIDTDLKDAAITELSSERKLGCCFNALLISARVGLRASGYRVSKSNRNHHYYAIQSLRHTVKLDADTVLRIEAVQKKRNVADYVRVGEVSDSVADDTLTFTRDVCQRIREWLNDQHEELATE